jgi:hypothetical protein
VAVPGLNPGGRVSAGGRDLRHLRASSSAGSSSSLIRRRTEVQILSCPPRRYSSAGQSTPLITGRPWVQVPLPLRRGRNRHDEKTDPADSHGPLAQRQSRSPLNSRFRVQFPGGLRTRCLCSLTGQSGRLLTAKVHVRLVPGARPVGSTERSPGPQPGGMGSIPVRVASRASPGQRPEGAAASGPCWPHAVVAL